MKYLSFLLLGLLIPIAQGLALTAEDKTKFSKDFSLKVEKLGAIVWKKEPRNIIENPDPKEISIKASFVATKRKEK